MADYRFNPNMISAAQSYAKKKKEEAEEKLKLSVKDAPKAQTTSAALSQNSGPINVPIKQTTKKTSKSPYRQTVKIVDTVPDYSETKRRLERQAREQIKRERENRFANQRILPYSYPNSPFKRRQDPDNKSDREKELEHIDFQQSEKRATKFRQTQEATKSGNKITPASAALDEDGKRLSVFQKPSFADSIGERESLQDIYRQSLKPQSRAGAVTGIASIGQSFLKPQLPQIEKKGTKYLNIGLERQIKAAAKQAGQTPEEFIKTLYAQQGVTLPGNFSISDIIPENTGLTHGDVVYDGMEKEQESPLLGTDHDLVREGNIQLYRNTEDGLKYVTGEAFHMSEYMTESELYYYYYFRGKSDEEAKQYLHEIAYRVEERAEKILQQKEYTEYGQQNPVASIPTMQKLYFQGAGEAAIQNVKDFFTASKDKKEYYDFTASAALDSIQKGRNSASRSGALNTFYMLLGGVALNVPEMALNLVPVAGPILSAMLGFHSGQSRSYGELANRELLNEKGSELIALVSGGMDAITWGASGKFTTKAIGRIFNKLPASTNREFLVKIIGYALGQSNVAITQSAIDTGLDYAFFNSAGQDRFSQIKQSFIEQGMSKDSATGEAIKELAKNFGISAAIAGITGSFTGAAKGLGEGFKLEMAGRKRAADGFGIDYETNFADSFDVSSQAYKNAQLLRQRMKQGKEIGDDMLGAQSLLNRAELAMQKGRIDRLQQLSGVKIDEGEVDETANAEYASGRIKVSETPDEDRLRVIQHDLTHAMQESDTDAYRAFYELIEKKGGFEEAVEKKKGQHAAAGKPVTDIDAQREVAADFAKSLKYTDADLDRLTRAAEGNTSAVDKIYNGLRDLSARMKAKKARYYTDPETGIILSISEIETAKRLFFNALTSINEEDLTENTPMFSLRKNLDTRNYGINIDRNLTDLAESSQMNKKLWTIDQKTAIKDKIRQAFELFKKGETEAGEKILYQAGEMFNSARKTPESPELFVRKFKTLYSQGERYLRTQGSDNVSLDDKRKYNIRVDSYTRALEHSNDIDSFSYADIHAKNVNDVRSAFEILRNGEVGAREQARSLLLPFAYRIAEDARERNPMFLEGDSDVLKSIRNLKINLEEFRNSPDGNMRQMYDDLKFVVTNTKRASDGIDKAYKDLAESYPQHFGKAVNAADQLREIRDMYNRARNNEYIPRYQSEQIDSAAHSIADQIIHDYYMGQKAHKSTPQKRANGFINRYGVDVEKPLREIGIEDITEGEVQGMGNVIRQTLEEIAGVIKNPDDNPDIEAYDALAQRMDRVIRDITKGKKRSSDDLMVMTNAIYTGICDLADGYIARKKLEAQDKLTRATINGEDTTPYKRTIENCDNASEMFRQRVTSKVYSNSAQKGWINDSLKSELDKNKESFSYDRISNKDAYEKATERVKNNDVLSLYEELITKDSAWDAYDTVTAQLVIQRLSNTGRTNQAVQLFEYAQKKTTEAGQMTQAWALAGRLTPEGRLMAFERKYNKLQGDAIDKIDPTGEKRRLWREAQELDNETRARAENEIENDESGIGEQYRLLKEKAEKTRKEMELNGDKSADKKNVIDELQTKLQEAEKKLDAENELKKQEQIEIEELRRNLNNPSYDKHQIEKDIRSHQKKHQQLKYKIGQLENEKGFLLSQIGENEKEYENAFSTFKEKKKELRSLNKEMDNLVDEFEKNIRGNALSHLEDFYNSHHFQHIKREDFEKWRDRLIDIEEITTADEAIDAIMLNSKMRKMPHGMATRAILKAEFKNVDVETLKNVALQQVYGAMNDKIPTKLGKLASTVLAGAQLLNPRTIIRNIAGNTLFDTVDGLITHNLAAFVDLLMVPFTKQRSVFAELPHGFINGFKRGGLSYLETALGVDLINRDGTTNARIGVQNYRQRTFKGNRLVSAPERLLSYSLTAPDEFQKGIIEAKLRRSISTMEKWGWKDFEIEKMIDEELKYRTFQDDSIIASTLDGIKKALNHIGTEDFGLGNLLTNYTIVPGNIVSRALEYSPLGTLKAIADIATITKKNVKHKMKLSPLEQRKIVLELTRPITGGGLIWAGWWLRKNGIIVSRPESAEDDFSEKEFYNTVNLDSFQLNLSALRRFVDGEGAEETIHPRESDELYDLSFIVGINSGLQIGSYLAENLTGDLAGYEKAAYVVAGTGKAALDQLTGLSMWMSINSIVNNWKYTDSFYQFAAAEGADLIMSFYPSVLRQLGNTLDPYARYPYKGETFGETMKYKIYSKLPFMGLRNEVPVRVDAFGERQSDTLGSVGKDIVQNFINPGYISVYNEHPVTNELERLSAYSTKILPTSPYSNQNVTIDGQKYSFTLSGKEYEQYSAMLGKLMSRAYINFGMDPDYKLLSDDMRVEKFEEIKKEIEKAAATAWISNSLGIDDDEITKQAEDVADGFKSAAGTYIKIRQAEDYLKTEEVPVETIAQSAYIMREYTDEETAEAIKDEKAKIARIKNGTQYRYETQADGSRKKVKARDWTAKEREVAIEQAEKNIKKLEKGERQKKQYISGRWYSLTDEEREKVSYYIEKYIDEIELPESATAIKPDMSGESSLTENSVIDVTKPMSEKQRDMALIDLGWKAPSPDEMGRADGGKAAQSYNVATKSHTSGYKKWSNYRKRSKGRRRSYSGGGGGGAKLYSGTKRYRAAIEYRDGVFRNRFSTRRGRRRFSPNRSFASHRRRNPFDTT